MPPTELPEAPEPERTPDLAYELQPLSFTLPDLHWPYRWNADVQHWQQEGIDGAANWRREAVAAYDKMVVRLSRPRIPSVSSSASNSVRSASTWDSDLTIGSSGLGDVINDLVANEAEEEPVWRGVVLGTMRFLGRLPGRAWSLLRTPRGPPPATPSPPASDGDIDSTRALSDIASSGSSTAVESEDSDLLRRIHPSLRGATRATIDDGEDWE